MRAFLKVFFALINPANNGSFVGKQLKKPNGFFASKVAKGMNVSNKNLYDLTFQNIDLKDYEKVLEIGFGNGYFFEQLSQKNQRAKLFGVEISKEMVRQGSKLNRKLVADKTLEIKHFDGLSLPYEHEMFDKAIAINLIYFWQDPMAHIKELNRVLKPNAELLVGIRPFDVLSQLPFAQENFNIQQDDWWIKQFEMLGFRMVKELTTAEPPLQFNGTSYPMRGICWVFEKM